MTRRARPRVRVALGALLAGLATMAIASTASSQSTPVAPLATIKGSGSWGPNFEMTAWQNALLHDDGGGVDMRYVADGTLLGRGELLSGDVDFVFSGVPFTDDELKQLPDGKADLIDVPMQVSTLGFLVSPPYPNGFQAQTEIPNPPCDPDDPPPPTFSCVTRTDYHGALNIPTDDLAAMIMGFGGTCPAPPPATYPDPHLALTSWTCRSVTEALGLGSPVTWVGIAPNAGPAPVLRSDPDETSYYVQQYVKLAAPDKVWTPMIASNPSAWDPITERFPRLTVVASRDGAAQQAQQLGFPSQNPTTGGFSQNSAGLIANVPPSAVAGVQALNSNVAFVHVRNGNGEYVAPTTDSINKAVAAGGDSPLYALTNTVAGAYPVTWIDHLYVNTKPTTPLTAEKVEALASMIRYLATDGQAEAAKVGEGQLTTALSNKAIAGADEPVSKACPTSSGATIVSNTDPGAFAPALPGVKAIGTMKHCQAAATATTTTTPIAAASSGTATGAPLGSTATPLAASSTPDTAPLTPLPGSTPATTPAAAPVTATAVSAEKVAKPRAETVVELPIADETTGFDRLALGVLGAGAFLVLRNPIRRLFMPGRL